MLNVKIIDKLSNIKDLEEKWLFLESDIKSSYYHSYYYNYSYFLHLQDSKDSPFIILIYNDKELIAIFPWEKRVKNNLFFTYYEIGPPKHEHIDLTDVVVAKKHIEFIVKNFSTLLENFPSRAFISTGKVRSDSKWFLIHQQLSKRKTTKIVKSKSSSIQTNGKLLQDYIPTKEYKDIKRLKRKINSYGDAIIKIKKGVDVTIEDMESFYKLESSGWKGEYGTNTAIGLHDNLKRYYNSFVGKNFLQLNILTLDNKPIAAQICFNNDTELSFPKIAFDENFKKFAPTILLSYAVYELGLKENKQLAMNFITAPTWSNKWNPTYFEVYSCQIKLDNITKLIFLYSKFREKIKTVVKIFVRKLQND